MSSSNSISNSRLTLSLPSTIKNYKPGSILHPTLTINCNSNEYTSLTLNLIGLTDTIIMGKDRFQAGAMANLGSGGSPMLITSIEKIPFLEIEVPLISSSGASSHVSEKKSTTSSNDNNNSKGGIYEVQLPQTLPGILPTSIKSVDDAAGVSVRYYLELKGIRKGLFKSNDKLQLDFNVVIPLRPMRTLQLKEWDSNNHEVNFKFKNENAAPLKLFAKFSVHPIQTRSTPLSYHLHLTSDSPNGISLLNNSTPAPIITISLARRVHTSPLKDVGLGKPFDWAGVRLVRGSLEKVEGGEKREGEGEEWKGEVVVPDGQVSVESKGLRIHYVLTCSIRSTSLERELIVKVNVFLPSADFTISDIVSEDYTKPPRIEDEEGSGSGLPSYSA